MPNYERNYRPQSSTSSSNSDPSDSNDNIFISSLLQFLPSSDPIDVPNRSSENRSNGYSTPLDNNESSPSNSFGAVGSHRSPSTSPPESSLNVFCGWCRLPASNQCLNCKEFICHSCKRGHGNTQFSVDHLIVPYPTRTTNILNPSNLNIGASTSNALVPINRNGFCSLHEEIYTYFCECCIKFVCQNCTFHEHKDHQCIPIQKFFENTTEKIRKMLEFTEIAKASVKKSIDKAMRFNKVIEKDFVDSSKTIHNIFIEKTFLPIDQEHAILRRVTDVRNTQQQIINQQTSGLRSLLYVLAENGNMLGKLSKNLRNTGLEDITRIMKNGQGQLDNYGILCLRLEPKLELVSTTAFYHNILEKLRLNLQIMIPEDLFDHPVDRFQPSTSNQNHGRQNNRNNYNQVANLDRQFNNFVINDAVTIHIPALQPAINPCIPGTLHPINVIRNVVPSLGFAKDGHNEGEVSRPWGLCVDKDGYILISDRRNNRIQIFYPHGELKFTFGKKGTNDGEFDLPAGICVDRDHRIIVVDKDNHRVQVFTFTGEFLFKFGHYGREFGNFQYPWDVAVNMKRQIIVTDSRNHRIQQFDHQGRFINQFSLDIPHIKVPASPRGVCYTIDGRIIVTDFDNHGVYFIDPNLTQVLSVYTNVPGTMEFNRPSGLCCDDSGKIVLADSKNQRIGVYSPQMKLMWNIDIHPPFFPTTLDERDRPCNVALLPTGHVVVMIELSPDTRDTSNPYKQFVQVY